MVLEERATVELLDYRDLAPGAFDKIVSGGMAEHVGRDRLGQYFSIAFRALRPGGLFLNHAIGQPDRGRSYRVAGFIARYIFPGGELVSIADMLAHAESVGFEVRDVYERDGPAARRDAG
ncbi:MAG: class I SAM-dependent methyltransferase [Vulcanimicrobiaceae bacterium]